MDQFSYINDFLNVEYADLVRHYIAPVNCKIIVEPWRSIVASAGVLIIKDTDAYGAVKSFTYNTRLLSRELLVKGQDYAAIRAPQSLDELIDKDIMPNWHAAQK